MELTYENIKSIILTILVGGSLLLTWSLWTYQPSYEELENGKAVQDVNVSSKRASMRDIVRPEQIIFHADSSYYGTLKEEQVEKVIAEINNWKLKGFERIGLDGVDIYSLVDSQEAVEIVFPSSITMNSYKGILGITDKEVPNFRFNQIIISLDIDQKEHGVIYFVSREENSLYRSMLPVDVISDFKGAYLEQAKSYQKYFPFTTASGRRIYLPEGETEMFSYQYLAEELDSEKFRDALFSDSSSVQRRYMSTGIEYTDASSLMKVNKDSNIINYVNPSSVRKKEIEKSNLLKKSIDFVNGHGGWTDHYRFVHMDNGEGRVQFRLYGQDGYPIFSENPAISEIQLIWGNNDVSRYKRNNFSIGLLTSTTAKKLESGEKALEKIQSMDKYNQNLLGDVKIGYEMKLNAQSMLIRLEPRWYYRYNGVWKPLTTKESGGERFGLE